MRQVRDGVTSVLVIEDDPDIRQLLRALLGREGYARRRGRPAGARASGPSTRARPDLVILDVGLPDLDGWQVLERIRDMSDAPVLVLTARSVRTRQGPGAQRRRRRLPDQALQPRRAPGPAPGHPAAPGRHHSTTAAHLRRRAHPASTSPTSRSRSAASRSLLTPTEYRLLSALVRHAGQVLSADQLIELAWDDPSGLAPARVKYAVLAAAAQAATGTDPDDSPLETVRGFGYRYRPRERMSRDRAPPRPAAGHEHGAGLRPEHLRGPVTRPASTAPPPAPARLRRRRGALSVLVGLIPFPTSATERGPGRRGPLLRPDRRGGGPALAAPAPVVLAGGPARLHRRDRPVARRPGRDRLGHGHPLLPAHRLAGLLRQPVAAWWPGWWPCWLVVPMPVVVDGPPATRRRSWRGVVITDRARPARLLPVLSMVNRERSYVADMAEQSPLARRGARQAEEAREQLASLLRGRHGDGRDRLRPRRAGHLLLRRGRAALRVARPTRWWAG